jgi:hypothetical protein
MSGAILPLLLYAFMVCRGTYLPFLLLQRLICLSSYFPFSVRKDRHGVTMTICLACSITSQPSDIS